MPSSKYHATVETALALTPKQAVAVTHAVIAGLEFDKLQVHPYSGSVTLTLSGRTLVMFDVRGTLSFKAREVDVKLSFS